MKKLVAGVYLNTSGPLLFLQAASWFGAVLVISRDLRWAAAAGVVCAIVLRAIVRPAARRLLARYTNDETIADTIHGATGRIEAVEYFWRPG